MSLTIPLSFAKQFEREVHLEFQKKMSELRSRVRVKNVVGAASTTFQKIGTAGMTQKARHGEIPPQDVDHTPVEVTVADWYARQQYDELDILKIQHDERGALVAAQANAAARKVDEIIAAAMNATTTSVGSAAAMSFNLGLQAVTKAATNNIDEPLMGVVSPHGWAQLLGIASFANADWVGAGGIIVPDGHQRGKRWIGADWFSMNELPKSGNNRSAFIWVKNALALAINQETTTYFWYNGEKDTWSIVTKLSMGSKIIDANGVIKFLIDESTALPS